MKYLYRIFCVGFIVSLLSGILSTPAFALSGPVNPYSFSATSGKQSGTVTINWYDDKTANQYNLFYGTDPSHYNFGQVALPDAQNTTSSFTINYLTPGQTYYFSLVGITGSVPNVAGPIAAQATGTNANVNNTTVTNHLPEYGFTAQTGTEPGTITLNWTDNETADKYDIVYGPTPGSLIYGVENVPFTHNIYNSYPIGALQHGQTYYFSLVAEKNGSIVLWSNPVSAVAK